MQWDKVWGGSFHPKRWWAALATQRRVEVPRMSCPLPSALPFKSKSRAAPLRNCQRTTNGGLLLARMQRAQTGGRFPHQHASGPRWARSSISGSSFSGAVSGTGESWRSSRNSQRRGRSCAGPSAINCAREPDSLGSQPLRKLGSSEGQSCGRRWPAPTWKPSVEAIANLPREALLSTGAHAAPGM